MIGYGRKRVNNVSTLILVINASISLKNPNEMTQEYTVVDYEGKMNKNVTGMIFMEKISPIYDER